MYQFLFFTHVSSGFHLGNVHGVNLSEVTLFQIFNRGPFLMGHFLQGDTVRINNIKKKPKNPARCKN